MKFKFYLRGLGVGLIMASFILIIADKLSPGDKVVTPTETQQQTKGIIAFDRDATKSEEESSSEQSETESVTVETESESRTEEPETEKITEPATQAETKAPETEAATQAQTETKPVPTKVVGERQTHEAGTVVTIKIKDVYYGSQAADILYYAGVIDDRNAYLEYIAATGYANIIKEGIYQVTVGDTYENISKIITRTN